MTDPESILRLGIEAAKEGNNDDARDLFRLLTREDPNNVNGWLWLAGVAETQAERRQALERVLALDPTNDLARQGLESLNNQTRKLPEDDMPAARPAPAAASTYDDDDPFAELDGLSDVFEQDPGAVRRADAMPDPTREATIAGAAAASAADSDRTPRERSRFTPSAASSSSRSSRFSSSGNRLQKDESAMSQMSDGLRRYGRYILLALALILALVFFLLIGGPRLGFFGGGNEVAEQPMVDPTATPLAGTEGGDAVLGGGDTETETGGETGDGTTDTITDTETPGAEGGVVEGVTDTETPGTEQPQPTEPQPEQPQPEQPAGGNGPVPDPAAANPQIVPANTPLESNGWLYDFQQQQFATYFAFPVGNVQPQQGRLVVVLTFVANRSGTTQSVPSDFFVLKDAQGRVYNPIPSASTAYLNAFGRGVAADLSQEDPVPADGITRSVPIVFDVPPDATDLQFFARSNPAQGWVVLSNVQ
ncbi:MAG: hypothetical protein HC876_06920 [Chloroflexaceae bacterium]|nr:hypothetical protein [Chloroflexaceae bacterium]